MRFPAKITSSCIRVAITVDWVILHWYARYCYIRTYGHVIAKIYRTGRLPHFLTHGAPLQILYPALTFTQNNCFP